MTGITPEVFTFKGILVDCPPTIFLPCTFFAYCTGIFLTPSFKIMTKITIPIIIARMIIAATTAFAIGLFRTNCSNSVEISCGIREIILMVRTMEIPFPTPFSVILSPIHIRNALPAVNAATTVMILKTLYVSSRP